MRWEAVFAYLTLAFLLNGCDTNQDTLLDLNDRVDYSAPPQQIPASNADVLRFGFDLRASPQEDARQYLPFLRYLEKATGYFFELKFSPAGTNIIDQLGKNEVQFALIGAVSYVQAEDRYGAKILVRGINARGKASYRSLIVIAPDSPITRVAQLKNKRFAFGSRDSTQGHLIPRIELRRFGLSLDDLSAYNYTGSHLNCANAVIARQYDACGMQDTMARELAQRQLVRILHESPEFPSSGIAANNKVATQVRVRVKQALLAFNPHADYMLDFYNWSKTEMPGGFVSAQPQEYRGLRQQMIDIGMLEALDAHVESGVKQ